MRVAIAKLLCTVWLGLVCVSVPALSLADDSAEMQPASLVESLVAEGEMLRNAGNLNTAQQKFDLALQVCVNNSSVTSVLVAAAKMASGYNLFLLNKKEAAEEQLKDAYARTVDNSPYIHALASEYIALLSLSNGDQDVAVAYNDEALKFANSANVLGLELRAELMRVSMSTEEDAVQADSLQRLGQRINLLPNDFIKASLQLALAQNILSLDHESIKPAGLLKLDQLTEQALSECEKTAENTANTRLVAEAQAGLVQLYRLQGKISEALALIDKTVEVANQINAKELLAQLEAQKGDLYRLQGDKPRALSAYEHAVSDLNVIAPDMPLTLPDGQSTINALIDPIHRKYADLLLDMAEGKDTETAKPLLVKAVDNMEIVKEADMLDFFLGKCTSDSTKSESWHTKILADAAIVYPILLPDRLALILKTDSGFTLHIDKTPASEV
jgi:tetratricopeptide (TPR) repeat protein